MPRYFKTLRYHSTRTNPEAPAQPVPTHPPAPADASQCLPPYGTMVESPVRFYDRIRKERRTDDFQSEPTARKYRNYRKQSESGCEGRRTRRTTRNERGKESAERGDSRMSFRRAAVGRETVRRHRQVRPEERGVQSGGKYLGIRVGTSEIARGKIVMEKVRERGGKTDSAEREG